MKCRLLDLDFNDSHDGCGITLDFQRSRSLFAEAIGIRALVEVWDSDGQSCGGLEILASFEEAERFAVRLLERIGKPYPTTLKQQGH